MLNHIRIVLVHTSHPGNIGAAARAMKTMGLTQLYLVSPKEFPHAKAEEMASGAADILAQAKVVTTLEEAIADCTLVVGSSARSRTVPWPTLTPRVLAPQMLTATAQGKVAMLFGRERTGLTNEELHRCQLCMQIPANPDYSSLNIAAAVQIVTYELRLASEAASSLPQEKSDRLATAEEMENFFEHLYQTLEQIDFIKKRPADKLLARLRRLFYRANLDEREVNILRGILTSVEVVAKSRVD